MRTTSSSIGKSGDAASCGRGKDATVTVVVVDKVRRRGESSRKNHRTIPVRGPKSPERHINSLHATIDDVHRLHLFLSQASHRIANRRTYQSRNHENASSITSSSTLSSIDTPLSHGSPSRPTPSLLHVKVSSSYSPLEPSS